MGGKLAIIYSCMLDHDMEHSEYEDNMGWQMMIGSSCVIEEFNDYLVSWLRAT